MTRFTAPRRGQAFFKAGEVVLPPSAFIYAWLRQTSGNPPVSGDDRDMNVDGSLATPGVFQWTVPPQRIAKLSRINIVIVDGGIGWNEFAGLGSDLTNGILLQTMFADGNPSLDFLEGEAIRTNADFSSMAGVDGISIAAAGDDVLPVRFSFFKAGSEIELRENESIRIMIRDDLTGITRMRAKLQGIFA
jgi:hypothetical protein